MHEAKNWRQKLRSSHMHSRHRAALLADDPLCAWCGVNRADVLDHCPPLTLFCSYSAWLSAGGIEIPSCKPCSDSQGGKHNQHAKHAVNSRAW